MNISTHLYNLHNSETNIDLIEHEEVAEFCQACKNFEEVLDHLLVN